MLTDLRRREREEERMRQILKNDFYLQCHNFVLRSLLPALYVWSVNPRKRTVK